MEKEEAILLVEQALGRIKHDAMPGGAYWRLMKVISDFINPMLDKKESEEHAGFLRMTHGMIVNFSDVNFSEAEIRKIAEIKFDAMDSISAGRFESFSDEEIKKFRYARSDIEDYSDIVQTIRDLIAIFKYKFKPGVDKWDAGGAHQGLTALIRYIAKEIPRCCGDDVGYVLARDGILIPFDGMNLPDRGDQFLPSMHGHFSFYETIIDPDEFANFK